MKKHRTRPPDFRVKFVALGWDGASEHYRTNAAIVRRWLDEEGREPLIAERAAYVARLRERDRAFRRRAAMLGHADPEADRLRKLGTLGPPPIGGTGPVMAAHDPSNGSHV